MIVLVVIVVVIVVFVMIVMMMMIVIVYVPEMCAGLVILVLEHLESADIEPVHDDIGDREDVQIAVDT
jgi:hypothetical protein